MAADRFGGPRVVAGLVVGWGEGQLTDQLAGVAVDDADVQVIDEQGDRGAGESGARPMWCSRELWRIVTSRRSRLVGRTGSERG